MIEASTSETAVRAPEELQMRPALPKVRIARRPSRYGKRWYHWIKRFVDVSVSVSALIVLFPVFLVIVACIAAVDGFPVIFRHKRVGRNGREILVYKFRTMVKDADAFWKKHPDLYEEFKTSFKLDNDPRVTRIGRFLRATSLDEFPQLINVLKGEMTLVGPRPIVPEELEKYGDCQGVYLAMTPGCAGLWQCSGRSDTSYAERIALDKIYFESASVRTDMKIMWMTAMSILRRDGAR